MIITQTPLRVSFFGGGTDFPAFYRTHGGAVLSAAIDKYVFVIVKQRFDDAIYLNYSRKEIVASVDEIRHDLMREAMRQTGVERGIEITTLADVPSTGTGLGSSSSVLVGLLHALYVFQGTLVTAERLAREACEIEVNRLGRPIGHQDQYIAAFGGLRFIEFGPQDRVSANRQDIPPEYRSRLQDRILLFYTDRSRNAETVLAEQRDRIPQQLDTLLELKAMAREAVDHLRAGDLDALGASLDAAWRLKKGLASQISDAHLDDIYARARAAGALGGKIAGAGGGGFLMLYVPPSRQDAVRAALAPLRELPVAFEPDGSKVVFNVRRWRRRRALRTSPCTCW